MKGTGIIRRVDELGRIVIPKEIRISGGIIENTPMEIFATPDGIVLKKYNMTGKLLNEVDALSEAVGYYADNFEPGKQSEIHEHIAAIKKLLTQKEQ